MSVGLMRSGPALAQEGAARACASTPGRPRGTVECQPLRP